LGKQQLSVYVKTVQGKTGGEGQGRGKVGDRRGGGREGREGNGDLAPHGYF